MKRRKIFLFAVLLPCILFSIAAVAFKPVSGKPVISTEQVYDDSDVYWQQQMDELDGIAYDTWVSDGSPSEDFSKVNSSGKVNHYCCKTSGWLFKNERATWVQNVGMGGRSNPNHVHYIDWETDYASGGWGGWEMFKVTVKYWTSEPCAELCNW